MTPSALTALLLLALPLASFSPRAVRRAASGDPRLLFGLAALCALPALMPCLRRVFRPAPWCRVVPDPLTADLIPVENGIAAALNEARVTRQPVVVDLLPLYDQEGLCRPYEVRFTLGTPSRRTAERPGSLPQALIRRPEGVDFQTTARFQVDRARGVRLSVMPGRKSSRLTVHHDAFTPLPGLRFAFHPAWRPLTAAVIFWNLGRHGPYAPINPTLPAWLLAAAVLWVLHQAQSRRSAYGLYPQADSGKL